MKRRRGCLIGAVVLLVIVGIAGWRVYKYFLLPNWEYRDEMAADWERLDAEYAEWAYEWRATIEATPADALSNPQWDTVRANAAIGVTEPYTPEHLINAPWQGPIAESYMELARAYVASPDETPHETLGKVSDMLETLRTRGSLTDLEQLVDPAAHDWSAIKANLGDAASGWKALDWAREEIAAGVARGSFAGLETWRDDSWAVFESNGWGPWQSVALLLAMEGHLAAEAGDARAALDRVEALYRLAGQIARDPVVTTWALLTGAAPIQRLGDRLLWRAMAAGDAADWRRVREEILPVRVQWEQTDALTRAVRNFALHEIRIRMELRGLDERLAIYDMYPAVEAIAAGVDADDLRGAVDTFMADLPDFALYTRLMLDDTLRLAWIQQQQALMPEVLRSVSTLRDYKEREGAYPETVEGVIDNWPVDENTGEALAYERLGDGFEIRLPGNLPFQWRLGWSEPDLLWRALE